MLRYAVRLKRFVDSGVTPPDSGRKPIHTAISSAAGFADGLRNAPSGIRLKIVKACSHFVLPFFQKGVFQGRIYPETFIGTRGLSFD